MLTEREYKRYIQDFKNGNEAVDYMCRNFTTRDDEQTRHWNDKETGLLEEDLKALSPQVPDKVIRKIRQLGRPPRGAKYSLMASLLKPYVSNQTLYKKDYGLWEDLFFLAGENSPYSKYIAKVTRFK